MKKRSVLSLFVTTQQSHSTDIFTVQKIKPLPNQPHLLNKYKINMWFSHFYEFGILSLMNILAPYQIDIVKQCGFRNGSIILI